jgi:tellurite resistance protein TehA-like permease
MDGCNGDSNHGYGCHSHRQRNLQLSKRLHHFTWSWFECTMSTGALATLLGQQPYMPTTFRILGCILFVLNLVLFVTFSGCIAYRFAHDRKALSRSLHHPKESFYFGTFWVSIALLIYEMNQYAVSKVGPWLTKTLAIAFWTYAACVFLVAVFQYHVLFDEAELSVSEAMPSWILPMYPFLILGPLAAALVKNQPQTSAMPIMLGGLCFQGLGWCFAYIIYTMCD